MSSLNRDILFLPFSVCTPLNPSYGHTALAKPPISCIGVVQEDILVFFPKLAKSLSPVSMILDVRFLYMFLIKLRNFPWIPSLLRGFYHQWVLGFCQYISSIYWYDHDFYSVVFWCDYIDFWMLKKPYTPGIHFTWLWCLFFLYIVGFNLLIFCCWRFLCQWTWQISVCSFPFL